MGLLLAHGGGPPSRWVTRWAHLLAPGGTVLDLACGSGRNALMLAEMGFQVEAVDRDAEAVASLGTREPRVVTRVADLEGRIAAYGIVAMGVGESHILNLCVDETLRGRGIGRQMLALLLERSRDAGMEDAFLEVRPSNRLALALYQSVGFVQVGVRKGYYQAEQGREDALVLKLRLVGGQDGPP